MTDDTARYNAEFEKRKKSIDETLLNEGGNFPGMSGRLDAEIKDLVYALNRLPFVYTEASCSGHCTTREDLFRKYETRDESRFQGLPKEGECNFSPGYIGLCFRKGDPSAMSFISDLSQIVDKYEGDYIENWKPIIESADPSLQGLRFSIDFQIPGNGKGRILKIEEGDRRNRFRKELIQEMHQLSLGYLHEQKQE